MKIKVTLLILIFLPLIGCDRVTKNEAVTHLKGQDPVSFFNGLFSLTYHENTRGMLSLGAHLPEETRYLIFTVLVGFVLFLGLAYIILKPITKLGFVIGLFILAGGFGNLYDRIFNEGRVVDFMLLQFGPLRAGVFNVADVAIMIGLFGFIFATSKLGQQLTKPSI